MQGREAVAGRRSSKQKGIFRAGLSSLTAALVLLIGIGASPGLTRAGVVVTHFGIDPSDSVISFPPEPLEVPPAIPVSLDGTTGTPNPYPSVPEAIEYDQLVRAQQVVGPLDTGLLGESVDYFTGQTDFATTDVSLRGSSALPVAIGRRYHVINHAGGILHGAFGDWDLDIPHVEGIVATGVGWTVPGASIDERCTYFGAPPAATVTTDTQLNGTITTTVPANEYNLGFTAVIPGQGRHELLLRATGAPEQAANDRVTTRDLWAVSCAQRSNIPVSGGPDEGFIVTTLDGVKYTFDQAWTRPYAPIERPADTSVTGVIATVDRTQVWMLPTKIEDRFGNSVVYAWQYGVYEGDVALKSITANDGRKITLTYSGGLIRTVVDSGGRTWTYPYQQSRLTGVSLPDGSSWSIDFANLDSVAWDYDSPTCDSLPAPSFSGPVTGTIQHPTGAHGVFTFNVTRRGRHGAPGTCLSNSAGVDFAPKEPAVYDVLALTKKQVTGPGITGTETWGMAYDGCTTSSCASTVTTTLTDARNFKTLMTFGAEYGTGGSGNEGMLQRKQSGGSGSAYLQDETYGYFDAGGHPYPAVLGTPAQLRGDVSDLASMRPVQTRTLKVDGATYTRTMGSPDLYGFPTTITRVGSDTKIDTLAYSHNTAKWVLGTVKTVTSGGQTEIDLTLDGNNQPTQVKRFGRVDRKFGYYSDGALQWIQDGGGNQTTFTNYSYGIPKNISYPDGHGESVAVSSLGQITSHTDPMNLTTGYAYADGMRRLTTITPPGGSNATSITWYPSSSGWSRTIATGAASTTDTYDAYLHSVKTSDTAGREVDRTFDPDGHTVFESYPTGLAHGITSTYDALGRLATQVDDQNRTTTYTPGANTLTVQDRNAHSTKYTYLAYDGPSTAWPVNVLTPAGLSASTTIQRDLWGKPLTIKRGSITRTIHYGINQLLYSIDEPETGTTTFTPDSAGNIKTVKYSDAVTETRSYDPRNRLTSVTYSDNAPSVVLTWKADGQRDTASRGGTTRTWTYSATKGLLTGESVTIDGTAYALGYDYDDSRHLKTLTYPDTTSVSLAPDAFGFPTQVGSYATGVGYFENGAIKAFTYGNAITHSLTQYDNGLPKLVKDTNILSATYTYDDVGNPLTVTGTPSLSRTLTYDTSDRLHTAAGPWGSGTMAYDIQDNLTGDTATGLSLAIDPASNMPTTGIWDLRGRLKQKGAGAAATLLAFDGSNLLTKIVQPAGTWTYAYDALGYRTYASGNGVNTASVYDSTGRLFYETSTQLGVADRIFQNGFDPVTAPTTATKYVYLGSHLVAKARTANGTTQVFYQHTDALGTPVAQTDASKNIVGTSTYQPYGGLYASTGNGNEAGPAYANQYGDPTGLIYMHARYYDPNLHRFISADPNPVDASTAINFNRYAYANNNPFRFYDPSGRESNCVLKGNCAGKNAPDPDLSGLSAVLKSDAFGEVMQNAGMGLLIGSQSGGNISEEMVEGEVAEQAALNAQAQSKASQLSANRAAGKAGEAITRASLGDTIAGEQVTFVTSDGTRARPDFVTIDNAIVETKTGGATLSSGQEKLKADIDAGREVTPVGENALKAGLTPGEPTIMSSCTVDRPDC